MYLTNQKPTAATHNTESIFKFTVILEKQILPNTQTLEIAHIRGGF